MTAQGIETRPTAAVISINTGDHREQVRRKRDALVAEYAGLVRPIAESIKRTLPASFELDDLIQDGMLALMRAATVYREETGVPFAIWARKIVRGALIDSHSWQRWKNSTMAPVTAITRQPQTDIDIDEEIDRARDLETVRGAIAKLDPQAKRVIETHYSEEGGDFERTAKVVGIDRRRVGEIHKRVLPKLRAMCVNE